MKKSSRLKLKICEELADNWKTLLSLIVKETRRDFVEKGMTLCYSADQGIRGGALCSGDACGIDLPECEKHEQEILIHSHPDNSPTSPLDLNTAHHRKVRALCTIYPTDLSIECFMNFKPLDSEKIRKRNARWQSRGMMESWEELFPTYRNWITRLGVYYCKERLR